MDFDVIRTSVKNAYQTYGSKNKETFNRNMSQFYTAGKENPSVAHMILTDQIKKEYSRQCLTNEQLLNIYEVKSVFDTAFWTPFIDQSPLTEKKICHDFAILDFCHDPSKAARSVKTRMTNLLPEELKPLKNDFETQYRLLYPKTYNIRRKIIENTDFSMDKVTPKLSYYEKIQLSEPQDGWRSIYPNSYENRCRLIGMDRLGKSGKVGRLKKTFWNVFFVKHFDMYKCLNKFK